MHVAFHLGAPCTDGDLLIKSLLKTRTRLGHAGVCVPPPGRYRPMLRDLARKQAGQPADPDMQGAILDALADEERVDRLVLSDPKFICINRLVVQGAQIWPMIARQTDHLTALFPDDDVSFFIGMRDPATLIPALFRASRFSDFEEFSENMQPHAVAWSEMLVRLRDAHPGTPITVWCNEDTPLLWGSILCALAGVPQGTALDGRDDLVETIMQPEGFARLMAYLDETAPPSDAIRRRVVAAFLEHYAREEVIEEEVDLPGWTEEAIAHMTADYEADMTRIAAMPGVRFLRP